MRNILRSAHQLTRRQLVTLLLVAAAVATTMVSAALSLLALATATVGVLAALSLTAMVQMRRRLSTEVGSVRADIQRQRAMMDKVRSQSAQRTQELQNLQAANRRLLAVVENERLAASDRHQKMLTKVDRVLRDMARHQREATRKQMDQTREVEALLQLYRDFRPRAPMPPSGRWAVNASGLMDLLFLIECQRPKLVLELGSGTSTVWMAYALEQSGGYLVSVDHLPEYVERTREILSLHGLEKIADVRLAPLRAVQLHGNEFQWYKEDAFTSLNEIDLLVVDGPPGSTGSDARYPAFPLLESRLSANATVAVDDTERPDEKNAVTRWLQDVPSLTQAPQTFAHLAVMTYARHQQ